MIDLPLAMLSGSTTPSSDGGVGSDRDGGFREVLTDLLGDTGREVAEMVETLEALAELDDQGHAHLTTVGWPLPQLLTLVNEAVDGRLAELADEAPLEELPELSELPIELALPVDGEVADEDEVALSDLARAAAAVAAAAQADGADEAAGGDEVDADQSPTRRGEGPDLARTGRSVARPASEGQAPSGQVAAVDEAEGGEPEDASAPDRRATVDRAAATVGRERLAPVGPSSSRPKGARVPTDVPAGEVTDVGASTSTTSTSRSSGAERSPGHSLALQRVLEAVQRLELMPPPRALTVDLAEHRLRVALEDGQVRLSLLDGDQATGDDFLRQAREELAQQGFDLGADGSARDDDPRDDEPLGGMTETAPRSPRPVDTGLRL